MNMLSTKTKANVQQSSVLGGLVGDNNMAAVFLFKDTNMAAVTSRETLYGDLPLATTVES